MNPRPLLATLFSLTLAASALAQAPAAPVTDAPYPGTLVVSVDATDIARRIFTVHEEIPVSAGELRLYYPKWLPGGHDPSGPIEQIGGLTFTVDGKVLPWRRDPLDMYSFLVDIPVGASKLLVDFQFLSPLDPAQGRIVVTPEIIGLQWNTVALYPAGYRTRRITVQPNVKLPEGWKFGTALEVATQTGASTAFKPVNFETFVDSPLLAGKYFKRFDLDPGAKLPVHMDVVADHPKELEAKPEILANHLKLVQQSYKLYGSQHFAHYDFLLSISDRYSGIGLEHLQSSENGAEPGYLTDPKGTSDRDLLAHEFGHSWNGKFRRGAGQDTANFNVPFQNEALWMYEGQNQYWGYVLAARSGITTAEKVRDGIASLAAYYDNMEGRTWRNLQDTTNQPIISDRGRQAWRSWQRSEDYYSEGQLIWFDADTLIREKSGGKKSLDDFARGFFGVQDGRVEMLPYVFADVVAALNAVMPHDWATFLRERLDGKSPRAPLDGLARSGWKLVYTEKPSESGDRGGGSTDFSYSLGMSLGKDMKIGSVLWNGPAFKAGLASSMTLVAVNGMAADADLLKDAVTEAKKSGAPIVLLVNNLDHIDTVRIDYRGGLRYPHLERIPGTPDRLASILAPRK
ncbi:MAG: M61 family metallopeptidase [Arenimonas sp.]|nr:M61 family metallopeptidase [Arenimonas sp.]